MKKKHINRITILSILLSSLILFDSCSTRTQSLFPDSYNISWSSPSKNAQGSMPLSGKRGAGANVWVQDGSIWLYPSHNGAYDEHARLLKLGCVRITPQELSLGTEDFKQCLDLETGTINITQGDFKSSLWFAGENLVIEINSGKKDQLEVSYGSWRNEPTQGILIDMFSGKGDFSEDKVEADTKGVLWYHRNSDHNVDVASIGARQGISPESIYDMTTDRVYGGYMAVGGGLNKISSKDVSWQNWSGKAWTGITNKTKNHIIVVSLGAALNANPQEWRFKAEQLLNNNNRKKAKNAELESWTEFWSRSHVMVNVDKDENDSGYLVGRNYQLFRYMLACNRDGELPLLFNGGIFTVDNFPGGITGNNNDELQPVYQEGRKSPDFRRWTYCGFMSQNQRWLGWPAIANGDIDLFRMTPSFYRNRAGVSESRARNLCSKGIFYPEPMDVRGFCLVSPMPNGLCGAEHLTYDFSMMLEHAWMALNAHDIMGYSIQEDIPWIVSTLEFIDSFYRKKTKEITGQELDVNDKLSIYPSNALEYATGAKNPLEVVSALIRITDALISNSDISEDIRQRMIEIKSVIPDIPIGERDGKKSILVAESFEKEYNLWEPGEMYAGWPYRMVGVTKPNTIQLLRDTWETIPEHRAKFCKLDYSWMPQVVNMATIASPEEAEKRAIYKMANNTAPQSRFPAFFGPGHDWLPDFNWGGSAMVGVQEMIVSTDPYGDGKIFLLHAWPKDWDLNVKLHVSQQTKISMKVIDGEIVHLEVTPKSREKDIVIDSRFDNVNNMLLKKFKRK